MKLRNEDFSLTPSERAVYGATITAKSLDNGDTVTVARTGMTAVEAIRVICALLDELPGNYRVVCISTPVSIRRDIYASRIALDGDHAGMTHEPEVVLLGQARRRDMLHPDLNRMTRNNKTRPFA